MATRAAAQKVIARYRTREPYTLAELLGVTIIEVPFKKLDGIATWLNGEPFIGLNQESPPSHKRAILAHEIGHLICHPHMNYHLLHSKTLYIIGRYEREANEFAAELLIPDEIFFMGGDIRILASIIDVPVALFKFKKMPPGIKRSV